MITPTATTTLPPLHQGTYYMSSVTNSGTLAGLMPDDGNGALTATESAALWNDIDGLVERGFEVEIVFVWVNTGNLVVVETQATSNPTQMAFSPGGHNPHIRVPGKFKVSVIGTGEFTIGFRIHAYSRPPA